ncbi:hypothetical protein IJ579_06165 [bacterium]|nr:hypothetical protein [bacterium]
MRVYKVSLVTSGSGAGVSRLKSFNKPQDAAIYTVNFTGNRNVNQIASLTPENNGLGLPETSQGGEGVVAFEAPESMIKHEGKDVRSFMPFWEHDNPKGGYKFLIHRGKLEEMMPANLFYSANPGEDIEAVAKKLKLKVSDLSYVIQSRPNGDGPQALSKYCILEPTSVNGVIERPSAQQFGEIERIPYALFKISENNPSYNKLKGGNNYFVYTPDLAKAAKPYAYDTWGNVPFEAEIINSDNMRAIEDILRGKMNTAEFGYYNPASVWCHDRPSATFLNHVANASSRGVHELDGVKVHATAHNTGRNYQGVTGDPFKMIAVVGDSDDVKALKRMPEFDILKKASEVGIYSDSLSPRESEIALGVIEPYVAPFKDGANTYNITKIPIVGVRQNPVNMSVGTVSYTFDHEMKSPDTPDAAKFLTDDYASIETKSVLNGSTPANLRLDDPNADFGLANGLSENKSGFKTFKYNGTNIEEIIEARESNAKWLTGLIEKAGKDGQEALNRLFFNEGQIRDGHNVLGYVSEVKPGDILYVGWGRADEQKGYNITIEGYLNFLKREDVAPKDKLKVKVVLGGGPWDKNARDFIKIQSLLDEIRQLDGGIYAHNIMYVNGRISNRLLVGCGQYGAFTSRREMCGITPLESKAGGLPYMATKTGGPVDYTNRLNGYLTQHAVELRPEEYGLTWESGMDAIDDARCTRQAQQVSLLFKETVEEYTTNRTSYIAKCKKNIEELFDWHNNAEYNRGKSANHRYLYDIWEVDKGWDARQKTPFQRLVGQFGEVKQACEEAMIKSKSRPVKVILAVTAGSLAVIGGVYMIAKNADKIFKKHSKSVDIAA